MLKVIPVGQIGWAMRLGAPSLPHAVRQGASRCLAMVGFQQSAQTFDTEDLTLRVATLSRKAPCNGRASL